MNSDFVARLHETFDHKSMAVVAKRLGVPHATVRNYYNGRLPAPEVLIKIALETNVSLNWLLIGQGDMYAGKAPPVGLGKFLEQKIGEIVDRKLAAMRGETAEFDIADAVARLNNPDEIMKEWFEFEQRTYPSDFGVVFFKGWETYSDENKIAAIVDAKRVLDRSLTA
jgi:transcriptional regulator with XRE-family HTH domain